MEDNDTTPFDYTTLSLGRQMARAAAINAAGMTGLIVAVVAIGAVGEAVQKFRNRRNSTDDQPTQD